MKTEVKKHSRFSASSAHRWLSCGGSIALIEKAPPQKSSKYAEEGTLAHSLLERFLKNPKDKKKIKIELIKKHGLLMPTHVEKSAEWIWNKLGEVEGAQLLTESKVHLDHLHHELSGTLDAAIVDEFGRLTVIDFKYGQGVAVSAKDNPQLIFYAIGAARKFDFNFKEVALVILQPRSPDPDGEIQEHIMSMDELLKWEKTFLEGVKKALSPKAKTNPGDHCKWCPAAVICPELSTKAIQSAQADFNDKTGVTKLPDPKDLDAQKISKALQAFPLIEEWIERVREYGHDYILRGGKIEGFKVVDKRATRKWVDEEKTASEAKKKFGETAFSHDLLSPAQLEKVVEKEWVEKRCSAVSSGTTLVQNSDKREAINQIERDFGK